MEVIQSSIIIKNINREYNPIERETNDPKKITPIYSAENLLDNLTLNYTKIGDYFDENKYFQDRGVLQESYARQGYVFCANTTSKY